MTELSIGDLSGVGKPAAKLISALSAACGKIYEPHHTRRMARAQADAMLILANAEADKQDIARRAAERFVHETVREQANLDRVVEQGLKALPSAVSDAPVDVDWMAMFASMAKTVSAEQLQSVWAKLLAHEVSEPGRVSRRTMSIVHAMAPRDATTFSRVAARVLRTDATTFLVRPLMYTADDEFEVMNYGVDYAEFMELASFGLFATTTTEIRLRTEPLRLYHGAREYEVRAGLRDDDTAMPIWPMTIPGAELVNALQVPVVDDHRLVAFEHLEHANVFINEAP